jgi:hypothetical protein
MAEAFYIGAYWGSRPEPVGSCADRAAAFLASLSTIDPLLASWFEKGTKGKPASASVQPSAEVLQRLLLAGRALRDDAARSVMSDLGFLVGLWNGEDVQVGITVRCGAAPPTEAVGNSVAIQLPEAEGAGMALYRRDAALGLMRAVVSSWEPSSATFTSHRLRNAQGAKPGGLVVGWATYLAAPYRLRIDRLPAGASAEPAGTGGTLITLGDSPTSVSEQLVMAVHDSLGDGLRAR